MTTAEGLREVQVGSGAQAYSVLVGTGALEELRSLVWPGRRVLVIHQPGRERLVSEVTALLTEAEALPHTAGVPDAEVAKEVQVLADLWRQLGEAGFTRDDLIIGVGGGALTDLAGFAAATWLRGVDVVQLPTSLLGIVDAAVGGKTGINTSEGKNLVGAFHEPRAVLCDPAWMADMRRSDYVAGLAEVIKCGFIVDPRILDLIEADPEAACTPTDPLAIELITRAVQVKADVVSTDLTEQSIREVLNYGHTLAHAIEQVEGYTWRHGDAVAVGMVFAAELGRASGRLSGEVAARHRQILRAVGLPTEYDATPWPQLRHVMARDKKSRGTTLRFIVLEDLAAPTRLEGPNEEDLERAFATLAPGSADVS